MARGATEKCTCDYVRSAHGHIRLASARPRLVNPEERNNLVIPGYERRYDRL